MFWNLNFCFAFVLIIVMFTHVGCPKICVNLNLIEFWTFYIVSVRAVDPKEFFPKPDLDLGIVFLGGSNPGGMSKYAH